MEPNLTAPASLNPASAASPLTKQVTEIKAPELQHLPPRVNMESAEQRNNEVLRKIFGPPSTPIGEVLKLVQSMPPAIKSLSALVERGKLQESVSIPTSKADAGNQISMTVHGTIDGRPHAQLSAVATRKSANGTWDTTYTFKADGVEPLGITQSQNADGSYRTTIQPPGQVDPVVMASTGPLTVDKDKPGIPVTIDGQGISTIEY
jgi:hypothetical protein